MEQLERIDKAYTVWHDGMINQNPYIGYQSIDDIPVVYAKSPTKAKIKSSEPYNYELEGSEPRYIDLKAKRSYESDLYIFENEKKTLGQIKRIISERKRIDDRKSRIESFPDDSEFYVQNGYVGNSVNWWRKGNAGYTTNINEAAIYDKQYILKYFLNLREEDHIWLASHVNEHIKSHVDAQYLDSNYLI